MLEKSFGDAVLELNKTEVFCPENRTEKYLISCIGCISKKICEGPEFKQKILDKFNISEEEFLDFCDCM